MADESGNLDVYKRQARQRNHQGKWQGGQDQRSSGCQREWYRNNTSGNRTCCLLYTSVDTAVIEDDIENFVTQFVGTNAYMAGQLVGEQMAKDYPDGADIAILDFPSNESCVDRVNGFLDGLGDNKDKFNIVAQQDGCLLYTSHCQASLWIF